MCVNPRLLDGGVFVACRKCWQCRSNRINDWVGRCIAESQSSTVTRSVTLTYGPNAQGEKDHERAAVLTYSDVQKYLKRLRYHGYAVRYFCVGEFGGAKGRAHWHLLLFFQGKSPNHELDTRVNDAFWDHGFSQWEEVRDHERGIRYVCKYIQKDLRDAERQRQVAMSRFPPLGAVYFSGLARRYAQQGISPREPSYHFRDVVDRENRTIKFRLRGASLDIFIGAFLDEWSRLHGGHPPPSDLITEYWDRQAQYLPPVYVTPFKPAYGRPWLKPPLAGEVVFSESYNSWVWLGKTETLFWSYDDKGNRAWHGEIRTEAQAERLRAAFERRGELPTYREASRGMSEAKPVRRR